MIIKKKDCHNGKLFMLIKKGNNFFFYKRFHARKKMRNANKAFI